MAEAIVPNSSIITQLISQSDRYYERALFTRVTRVAANSTSFSYDQAFTNASINTADFGVYQIRSLRASAEMTYAPKTSDTPSDFAVGSSSSSDVVSNIPTAVGSSNTINMYNYNGMGFSETGVSFSVCLGIKITKLESGLKIEPVCSRYTCISNSGSMSIYYDLRAYIAVAFL